VSGDPATALYIGPAVIHLLLLFAAPLALVGVYSFLGPDPDGGLTFDNYRRALDPLYLRVLWHSVWLALATTSISLLLAYPCVLALRTLSPRARILTLALLIVPSWLNLLIKNYAWIIILRREGLLNSTLATLGLIDQPLPLLFNDGAVLIGLVHTYLPFMILPLFAAVDRMDWSLVEAARDLGAGHWQTFRNVVLPQTRVGMLVGSILVFIPTLGAFVTPDLLGGVDSLMMANVIENQVLQVRDWPLAAALSMLLIAFVLVAVRILQGAGGGSGLAPR
jgi:spermidine/putrescine transport system permease protein